MVKAYLLTFVTQRYFRNPAAFATTFPHPWLVWEPGDWKAPAFDEKTQAPRRNHDGEVDSAAAMAKGDALCFALRLPTENRPVRVGRAPSNELVINDGTVSREHLSLTCNLATGLWTASLTPHSAVTTYRGSPFPTMGRVALANGDVLGLGNVALTFHDLPGFPRRLDLEVKKQLGRPTA